MIRRRDLRHLPFHTLAVMARAVARDIDRGHGNKRELLEWIFTAIRETTL